MLKIKNHSLYIISFVIFISLLLEFIFINCYGIIYYMNKKNTLYLLSFFLITIPAHSQWSLFGHDPEDCEPKHLSHQNQREIDIA